MSDVNTLELNLGWYGSEGGPVKDKPPIILNGVPVEAKRIEIVCDAVEETIVKLTFSATILGDVNVLGNSLRKRQA